MKAPVFEGITGEAVEAAQLWASQWSPTGGIVGKLVEGCVRDLHYVDTAGRRVDQRSRWAATRGAGTDQQFQL